MTERRTEGNLELIEAAMQRLIDLHEENDNDLEKILDLLDTPIDGDSVGVFLPDDMELLDLITFLQVAQLGSGQAAVAVPYGFAVMLAAKYTHWFLVGYLAAKMEAGEQ